MKVKQTIGRKIIITPDTFHDEALLDSFLKGKVKFSMNSNGALMYEDIVPVKLPVSYNQPAPTDQFKKFDENGNLITVDTFY